MSTTTQTSARPTASTPKDLLRGEGGSRVTTRTADLRAKAGRTLHQAATPINGARLILSAAAVEMVRGSIHADTIAVIGTGAAIVAVAAAVVQLQRVRQEPRCAECSPFYDGPCFGHATTVEERTGR